MAAVGPEEVERLKQEIIRLTQVLIISLMNSIVKELMFLMVKMIFKEHIFIMVNSYWLLGGPGFVRSGLVNFLQ